MSGEQKSALVNLAWRLMNNAVGYRQEPEGYVPIRLLDGVLGILEVLALEDNGYERLMQQVNEAKAFAIDDTEKMVELLNRMILENVLSRRAEKIMENAE